MLEPKDGQQVLEDVYDVETEQPLAQCVTPDFPTHSSVGASPVSGQQLTRRLEILWLLKR